jgi:hypothetical protein
VRAQACRKVLRAFTFSAWGNNANTGHVFVATETDARGNPMPLAAKQRVSAEEQERRAIVEELANAVRTKDVKRCSASSRDALRTPRQARTMR